MNSAERLYNMIKKINAMPQTTTGNVCLAEILGVDANDRKAINLGLNDCIDLVNELIENINNSNEKEAKKKVFINIFNKFKTFFENFNIHGQIHGQRAIINSLHLSKLDLIIHDIDESNEEAIIEENILTEYQKKIYELIIEVSNSKINFQLKSVLLEELNNLSRVILQYKSLGVRAIEKIVKSNIGALALYKDVIIEEVHKSEENKVTLMKTANTLLNFGKIIYNCRKPLNFLLKFFAASSGNLPLLYQLENIEQIIDQIES